MRHDHRLGIATRSTLLAAALLAACSHPATPGPSQSALVPALLGGPTPLGPPLPDAPSDPAKSFDDSSGYPFLSVDRTIPLDAFGAILRDAVVNLPGRLAPGNSFETASKDVQDFLSTVQQNTLPHRRWARFVQVYSDAPVYLVGSQLILPDEQNNPVDPNPFWSPSGLVAHWDPSKVEAFCAANRTRCVSVQRSHPTNVATDPNAKNVGLVAIAARNVIVKGGNFTDGLSLVVMAENLLMPTDLDHVNLGPGGGRGYGKHPWIDVIWEHPAGLAGTTAPAAGPPAQLIDLDTKWQLAQTQALSPTNVDPARIGLSGLHGGSLFALAYRATDVRAHSIGQSGSDGVNGQPATPLCTNGFYLDYDQNRNAQPALAVRCDARESIWDEYAWNGIDPDGRYSDYCQQICPIDICTDGNGNKVKCDPNVPDAKQNGAPSGQAGLPGSTYVYSVTTAAFCGHWSESALRDDGGASATRFDRGEGINTTCGYPGACTVFGMCNDANIDVCGTTLTDPPAATDVADYSCTDYKGQPEMVDLAGNPGKPGAAGGRAAPPANVSIGGQFYCEDPAAPWTKYLNTFGGPVRCGAPLLGNNGAAPPQIANTYGLQGTLGWSREAWAIAVDRLHPMELARRISVAARRYKTGQIDSANVRYREAQFLIEANQRRNEPGSAGDGSVFACNPDAAIPDGLQEICAMRLEVDKRLHSLARGENYYGYPRNFVPPAAISAGGPSGWVQRAKDELVAAQNAVALWATNARIRETDADVQQTWDLDVNAEIATLQQTYASDGTLTKALVNAQHDHDSAIAVLSSLHDQERVLSIQIGTLQHPVTKQPFSLDDLEKFVISKGVAFAVTALAPEVAGAAFALSEALSSGLDKDLSISGVKIWNSKDDATKAINGWVDPVIKQAFPGGDLSALTSGADSDASKATKIAGLQQQASAIILQEREQSRVIGQAIREIELAQTRISEAKAQVIRLSANKAEFVRNRYQTAYFENLLKADYETAVERTERAGELAFLAKRATEHDLGMFKVHPDGTQENELDGILGDPCGGSTPDDADARFEDGRLACLQTRMATLANLLDARSSAFPYGASGHVTRVVPIDASMRRIDPVQGPVYDVPVDVALDDVFAQSAVYNDTRTHVLSDFSVFVDTNASGRSPGSAVRDTGEVLWLGVDSLSPIPGGDQSEYVHFTYSRGGATVDSHSTLAALFNSPEWREVPRLIMDFCRGSAGDNQKIIDGNGQIPLTCKLTNNSQVSPSYVGRSLLGRYTFTVPESAISGPSAMRVDFQFLAKLPQACIPTAGCQQQNLTCGKISDGCGGTIDCGGCYLPQTCGGGGTPGQCGCPARTCSDTGANCGLVSNGCGLLMDCGTCAAGDTCGGGGTPNVCGHPCVPTRVTCPRFGCAELDNGCGQTVCCGGAHCCP
jgi:hypothetical protein